MTTQQMHSHLDERYWNWAESVYTDSRCTAEIEYVRNVLEEASVSARVVVLGCGPGRHAIALAQLGFEVVGLDASAWAIDEARRRASRAGVNVEWAVVDPLAERAWPLAEVDVAVCVDALGWGSDADHRRFLRRVRRHMAPGGILIVLDPGPPYAEQLSGDPMSVIENETYASRPSYDPITGRCLWQIEVNAPGREKHLLTFHKRLYSAVELIALVRSSGFAVSQAESSREPRQAPIGECGPAPILARAVAVPPASLAPTTWRTPPDERLDLRYAPDEAAWLDPSPDEVWASILESELHQGAEAAGHYPVDDPYGAERGADVVGSCFGCSIPHHRLTFGPGVTSLLHDLCDLSDGGLILSPQLTHPDLTAWAVGRGYDVHLVTEPASLERLIAAIRTRRPSLVHFDRPNFAGDLVSLDDLRAIALEAAQVGAVVLVDESPANYLGPAQSAVRLTNNLDNLVVLRGHTKAYSWGGLRVAFAVASEAVSGRVRELVPPLQVSELAFRAVLRLLQAGDIFAQLRRRIRWARPIMAGMLAARRFEVIEGHPDIPWIVTPDPGGETSRQLANLGIRGLRFVPSPAADGLFPELLLLFCPLSEERMEALRQRLEDGAGGHSGDPELALPGSAIWQGVV